MEIWHNPRCTKSRQTLALINDSNEDVSIREYLKDTPTEKEIRSVLSKLGIDPVNLIRKSESIFKDNFKGKILSNDQWIQAMADFPKLIERPIVIKNDRAIIGRPPTNVLSLIK